MPCGPEMMVLELNFLGRRRVHSEEALKSARLKNWRAGHLSRVTTLCRATKNLLSDAKNVDGVTNKLQEINEAFSRFEKAHYDYIATLSGDLEEWESEAYYFQEHYRRKMNFVSRIEQWIHRARSTVEVREVSEPNPEDSVSTASTVKLNLLRVLSNWCMSFRISSPKAVFDSQSGPATHRKSWNLFLKLKEPNQC